jgi:hypothetical protein
MMLVATLIPAAFESMAIGVSIAMLISVGIEVIAMCLGYCTGIAEFLFIVCISLHIGRDWVKAQACPKTLDNAVDSTVDLYIEIIALFILILRHLADKDNGGGSLDN